MKRLLAIFSLVVLISLMLSAKATSESSSVRLRGDVDGDGNINGCDANLVSAIIDGSLTEQKLGTVAYEAADCNYDGVVDAQDMLLLQKAGLFLVTIEQHDNGWLPGVND